MQGLPRSSAGGDGGGIAFVTPSFLPDLARCELLVESVRTFAPQIRHYLVLDRRDLHAFRHLAGSMTILVAAEDLLEGYRRMPGRTGVWLNRRTPPVRGWIAQQMMKLALANHAAEDILICLDSDVTFLRYFGRQHIMVGDRIGLLDVGYANAQITEWTRVAERLLGLPANSVPLRGHVGNLVAWSRRQTIELHRYLEKVNGLPWQVAVGRCIRFSEYMLYGVYTREIVGYENSSHAPSDVPLVRPSWDEDLSSPGAVETFVRSLDPGNVAVMFHSKKQVPFDVVGPVLRSEIARRA